jgi:exo-beta-1,3-glucanase (GH17 family)
MPTGSPATEPSYEEVLEDMNLMAPYTQGIRTYGSGLTLHNGQYVPTIADALGLDLHMGIWLDDSYADEVNMAAIDDALSIVEEGHPSIKSLIVGNEYMLRVRQSFGDTQIYL